MSENSKVTLGEARKTIAAAVGLVSTVVAYVVTDATLSQYIPPQYVALAGGILTVLRVFFVPNDKHEVVKEVPVEVPVEVPTPVQLSPVEMITGAVQGAQSTAQVVADGLGQLKDIVGVFPGLISLAPDMPGPLDDMAKDFVKRATGKP